MTIPRSSNSNSADTGTAVSVTAPTGVSVGDVVLCFVHVNTQTTIADNNGSTPFVEDINDYKPNTIDGHTMSIFTRRIQAGDPSTYNFTSGASGRWTVIAVAFQAPHPTFYDVAPSTANAANLDFGSNTASITAPSINTLTDNALHILAVGWDTATNGTLTPPSGYTIIISAPDGEPSFICYKLITHAGATGSQVLTYSDIASSIAFSFSIRNNRSLSFIPTLRPRIFAPGLAR